LPQREPIFRGPWPVWTIAGLILASYAVQSQLLSDAQVLLFAMVPAEVTRGFWPPLLTALFIHGNWAHAASNAVGAVAFGAPAARYLGLGPKGASGYFLLFLVCGVVASLGYALLHPHSVTPVAGASGAVSGLLGASMRLADRGRRLSPLATRSVIASTAAWVVVNGVMGVLHFDPVLGEVRLAWEAHIIGYFAGLLLIAPFGALFGEPPPEDQDEGENSDGSIQSAG
jgi:membrane associated rhomboid family serine protease